MASRFAKLLNERGNHQVGNLNSHVFEQVNEGAIVGDETIDNFLLVELYLDHEVADDATSPMVRKGRVSADVTKNTHLIAAIEERVSIPGFYTEQFDDFFNEGKYSNYSRVALNNYVEQNSLIKVGKLYKIGKIVVISYNDLRKQLETDKIIKGLDYGF